MWTQNNDCIFLSCVACITSTNYITFTYITILFSGTSFPWANNLNEWLGLYAFKPYRVLHTLTDEMKNVLLNSFYPRILQRKFASGWWVTIWALKHNGRKAWLRVQCLVIWYPHKHPLHLFKSSMLGLKIIRVRKRDSGCEIECNYLLFVPYQGTITWVIGSTACHSLTTIKCCYLYVISESITTCIALLCQHIWPSNLLSKQLGNSWHFFYNFVMSTQIIIFCSLCCCCCCFSKQFNSARKLYGYVNRLMPDEILFKGYFIVSHISCHHHSFMTANSDFDGEFSISWNILT